MGYNSKTDTFTPPRFGVRLLEMLLLSDVSENEIGDLAEEYHAKAQRGGLMRAWLWLWAQALITLMISIKEDGIGHTPLGKKIRWHWRRAGSSLALLNGNQTTRHSLIALISSSWILFFLIAPHLPSPLLPTPTKLERQLPQVRVDPDQSEPIASLESTPAMGNEKVSATSTRKTTIGNVKAIVTTSGHNAPSKTPPADSGSTGTGHANPPSIPPVPIKTDFPETFQPTNIEGSPDHGAGRLAAEGPKPEYQGEKATVSGSTNYLNGACLLR